MAVRTATSAAPYVPASAGLDDLREAANGCRGCDLYRDATQAVVSSGGLTARVVMIGEQPGDMEDRKGEPFVGPAGGVLSRAIQEAGIDTKDVYFTNAVKHFKFRPQGKRRIHEKPSRGEVLACRPWLQAEFGLLHPEVVVALGATAAQALAGPSFRVTKHRGERLGWPDIAENPSDFPREGGAFIATVHPAAVLRATDRDTAYAEFAADLRAVAAALR